LGQDTLIWHKKARLPETLSVIQFGSFLIDSDFYIAGGWVSVSGSYSNEIWRYHIPSDSWLQLRDLPFGGSASSCSFSLNGKGYFLTASDAANGFNCDTTLWEYDPLVDSWTRRAGFPDESRENSSVFSYQNKGYVLCTDGCGIDDNHLWQYDPVTDKWRRLADLPAVTIAAARSSATNFPASITYFIGGNTSMGNFINDIWSYNINNNSWDSLGQMVGAPRAASLFWSIDSLLIGGGGEDGSILYNDFYIYNTTHKIWTPVNFQNFTDSAYAGATFTFGKTLYYAGGPTDLLYNTVNLNMWSFDASRFFPDTTTGITNLKTDASFILYPNPVSRDRGFSISTSESGEIFFYDELGRTLDERKLNRGITPIKLATDEEVVFYRATLQDGSIQNGKVVLMK
jgi:N-acetylneuraminic acid mutarotase